MFMEKDLVVDLKLAVAFDQIDASGNHFITRDDLLAIGFQLCSAFRVDISTAKSTDLFDAMIRFWAELSRVADSPGHVTLDRDEFAAVMRELLLDTPTGFDEFFAPIARAVFALADFDDDGMLAREEFTAVHVILGTPVEDIAPAFAALDLDTDGRLSTDELLSAAKDFYASSDPEAPGNVLFGQLERLS